MHITRTTAAAALAAALIASATACGGGSSTDGGGKDSPEGAHLLGQQPGHQPRDGQEVADARAREVRAADRDQGQARGHPVVRPAQPDPRRDHLRAGPRRPQHRQHLVRLAAGHRRAAPLRRQDFDAIGGKDRFVPSALGATGAEGKDPAAVPLYSPGVRAVLQQEDVRRRGHRQPAGDLGRARRRRQEAHQGRQVGPRRRGRQPLRERPPRLRLRQAARRRLLRRLRQADLRPPPRRSRPSSSTSTSWPRTRSPPRATPSTPPTSPSPTSPPARPPCCCGRPPAPPQVRTA